MPSLLSKLSVPHPFEGKDSVTNDDIKRWLINEIKMLFLSRSRYTFIESITLVNESILNYGFNECHLHTIEPDRRLVDIEERIRNVLRRFEPRLTEIVINTKVLPSSVVIFDVEGFYKKLLIQFKIVWDDRTSRLDFNE